MKQPDSRSYRRSIIVVAITCALWNMSQSQAQDVELNPATINGTIRIGANTVKAATMTSVSPEFGNSTLRISPNDINASYSATVNVPDNGSAQYTVRATGISLETPDGLVGVSFNNRTVNIVDFAASQDFIIDTPAILSGTVTLEPGAESPLQSIGIFARSSDTVFTKRQNYSSQTDEQGRQIIHYTMPVPPGDITCGGNARVSQNIQFSDQQVTAGPGQQATCDFTISDQPLPDDGQVQVDLNLTGPVPVDTFTIAGGGPATTAINNSATITKEVKSGFFSISAYASMNSGANRLYLPRNNYTSNDVPPERVQIEANSLTTATVNGCQSFINSQLNLSGSLGLSNLANSGVVARNLPGPGRSEAKVDATNGSINLIVAGDNEWKTLPLFMQMRRLVDDPAGYLRTNIRMQQDARTDAGRALTCGEVFNAPAFDYAMGTVTVNFSVTDGSLLSNPRITGQCTKRDDNGDIAYRFTVDSGLYPQVNTELGSVIIGAPEADCTLLARATVSGSTTVFGELAIEVTGGTDVEVDIGGPALTVIAPEPGLCTADSEITIEGSVSDDSGIASLTLNNVPLQLTPDASTLPTDATFTTTAPLQKGPNQLVLIATDTADKSSTDTRTVYSDSAAPVITWNQPVNGSTTTEASVQVEASFTDDAGIASVTVNGEIAQLMDDGQGGVSISYPVFLDDGENMISIVARDISGCEETVEMRKVTLSDEDLVAPVIVAPADLAVEASGQLTAVDIGTATATDNIDGEVQTSSDAPAGFPLGETTVTWTATDTANNNATATQLVTIVDTTPPVVEVPADILLESASDSTSIDIGQATAIDIYDGELQPVNNAPAEFPQGTTEVTWTAVDSSGNSTNATQLVTVEPPPFVIDVNFAKSILVSLWPNKDYFTVKGKLTGTIDAENDGLSISFAGFQEQISGSDLSQRYGYRSYLNLFSPGIKSVRLRDNGHFVIVAHRINLTSEALKAPVTFSINGQQTQIPLTRVTSWWYQFVNL